MLKLREAEPYVDLPGLADCYEHIADVVLALNDYSLAYMNYDLCLKARERYYYSGHPDLLRIINIIADLLIR